MTLDGWTINGFNPEDFGIEDIVVHVQNMDDDYCELKIADAFDATPPFADGDEVVLAKWGNTVFSGKIDHAVSQATGSAEGHTLVAYGPWHFLAKEPFTFSYPYVGGAATTTHASLKGTYYSIFLLFTAQAEAAGIIGGSPQSDVVNFTVPPGEVYDVTIAEVIRSVLRWVPGAIVAFNYAVTPPRMFIWKKDSTSLLTVVPSLADCQSLQERPRHDLVLDGVQIHYESRETRKTRTWRHHVYEAQTDETEVTYDGYRLVSTDSAGASTGRVLRKTILLEGSRTITTIDWEVLAFTSLADLLWTDPYWLAMNLFMAVNVPRWTSIASAPDTSSFVNSLSKVTDGVTLPTNQSTGANWHALWRTGGGSGDGYDNLAIRKVPEQIQYSEDYTDGLKLLSANIEWTFTHASHPTNGGTFEGEQLFAYRAGGDGTISGQREVIEGEVEDAPTGIAAAILSAYSTLQHEGRVSCSAEASPLAVLGSLHGRRKLVLPTFDATIQRLTYTASTNMADIDFGPPVHLGPQDILSLLRAGRRR